ncbi:MAG: LuxR family transcriptional regulator [Chitinophagaceae bacterium]|nr:MAG: LuxR family transcriptional regulator [Chitinophagaceae bacterium]
MSVHRSDILVAEGIREIERIADKLPGVVIIHDLRDLSVAWMSASGLALLGITLKELRLMKPEEYYGTYFNPEDVADYSPKIRKIIEENKDDAVVNYFQQVRFKPGGDWEWHFTSTKVFIRDDDNKPLLAMSMAFAVESMHHMVNKAERLLEENNFLRRNSDRYALLSFREREVLKLLALGKSSAETAAELFIAQYTVDTHRRNIRQKLDTNSFFELTQYARAFDLI